MSFNLTPEQKKQAFTDQKLMPLGWWVGKITRVNVQTTAELPYADVFFRWFFDPETPAPEQLEPSSTRFWDWDTKDFSDQAKYNLRRYITFLNAVSASVGEDIDEIERTQGLIVLGKIGRKKNGFLAVVDFDAVPSNRKPFNVDIS